MAKSSRSSRRSRKSGTEAENRSFSSSSAAARGPQLKPETRHGVVIVLVLTLAAIIALSVFGLAGSLGTAMNDGVGSLIGWQRYVVWFYLAAVGVILLFPERFRVNLAQWFGFALTVWTTSAIMQMFVPLTEAFHRAVTGAGGGYLGYVLEFPLRTALGPWAAGVVIIALFIIGLLVMGNTTLQALVRQGTWPSRLMARWRQWWWQRKLARAQQGDESSSTDIPAFQKQDVSETLDENPAGPTHSVKEETYVPLPIKPQKREKRQIAIPLDLLDISSSQPTSGNIEVNKEKIRKTLETFGIAVEMDEVHVGPTVTQFTLKPADGVRLAQIASLSNDLALALAAHPIRIEAPIPGKSLVGIEVPNQSVAIVNLRDVLNSDSFKNRKSDLTFSLGKDVSGQPWTANLDPLPHLLIAGATGSGKSVQINGLILSLLYSNSPDDLKLILVDPKRVELSMYNDIPHLLTPVITDTTKTINALRWVVSEMDRRYQVLQNAGKRNIATYRQEVNDDLPYIVVIIDELADLMSVAAKEVEGAIVRLAQMARAVGIHLVLATQRPSVDVITGLIKANVTARIAFSVASQVDSRTILDMSGAEKLLGKGDLLFVSAELSKPKRLQGAYVSEQEVERVVQFLKTRGQPDYLTDVVDKPAPQIGGSMEDLGDDELLSQAKEVIVQAGKASASLLQRRLRVGYARAARILDLLEEEGFIGPGEGAKPREVFGSAGGDQLGAPSLGIPAEPEHLDEMDDPTADEDAPETDTAADPPTPAT